MLSHLLCPSIRKNLRCCRKWPNNNWLNGMILLPSISTFIVRTSGISKEQCRCSLCSIWFPTTGTREAKIIILSWLLLFLKPTTMISRSSPLRTSWKWNWVFRLLNPIRCTSTRRMPTCCVWPINSVCKLSNIGIILRCFRLGRSFIQAITPTINACSLISLLPSKRSSPSVWITNIKVRRWRFQPRSHLSQPTINMCRVWICRNDMGWKKTNIRALI